MATTYMERYLAGEHEQVWDDLVALGSAVREEPVYADARALADETMRRVRSNLELLIPRLAAIGYQFGYGWVQPPANHPFDWQQRQHYLDKLAEVKEQPAILTVNADVEARLTERRERLAQLRALGAPRIILDNEERRIAELEAQPRAATTLEEMEKQIGTLPLSLWAWYEVVGGVNLVGVHPDWTRLIIERGEMDMSDLQPEYLLEWGGHPMRYLEPLQVWPLKPLGSGDPPPVHTLAVNHSISRGPHVDIMPNGHWAYLEQGQDCYPYEIAVPCASADAPLLSERHETTFVNYLRISLLRWAGFPGWEQLPVRPERDIATLTEGLLPF